MSVTSTNGHGYSKETRQGGARYLVFKQGPKASVNSINAAKRRINHHLSLKGDPTTGQWGAAARQGVIEDKASNPPTAALLIPVGEKAPTVAEGMATA